MNDNVKKIIIPAVAVVIVLVAGVWYLLSSKKQVSGPANQPQNNQTQPEASKLPPFVMGTVTKIEGQTITLKSGTDTKTILTTSKTEVIQQVKDQASYKNVDAKFNQIKVSSEIVVYYTQSDGLQYTAGKIQILPL